MTPIPYAAKAYIALAGAVATALLGVFAADTPVGQVLTVIAVVATAVTTYAVPNRPAPRTLLDVVDPRGSRKRHAERD